MKTIIAATAFILIGVLAWATTITPRVAAATSDAVNPFQVITNAL